MTAAARFRRDPEYAAALAERFGAGVPTRERYAKPKPVPETSQSALQAARRRILREAMAGGRR